MGLSTRSKDFLDWYKTDKLSRLMRYLRTLSLLPLLCVPSLGQRGTAPDGYYPISYSGDTYTGRVVDSEERKITLEYNEKSNTEQFTGVTTEPCMAPVKADAGTRKELHLTAIPRGSIITVFYNTKKIKKANGEKEQIHVVIGFSFNELNGEKLNHALPIPCFTGSASFTHYSSGPVGKISSR